MLFNIPIFFYGQGNASSHTSFGLATLFMKNKRSHCTRCTGFTDCTVCTGFFGSTYFTFTVSTFISFK